MPRLGTGFSIQWCLQGLCSAVHSQFHYNTGLQEVERWWPAAAVHQTGGLEGRLLILQEREPFLPLWTLELSSYWPAQFVCSHLNSPQPPGDATHRFPCHTSCFPQLSLGRGGRGTGCWVDSPKSHCSCYVIGSFNTNAGPDPPDRHVIRSQHLLWVTFLSRKKAWGVS